MKEIVIIGAGDFGKEVAWLIEDINKQKPTYIILGYLDDDINKIKRVYNGYQCLGPIAYLNTLNQNHHACAVIAMQNGDVRKKILESLPEFDAWETLIHPSVHCSETSHIGKGCIVCANTNISVNTTIGDQCIFNIAGTVGHDCEIGDYVSVMSGAVISGHVQIGENAYLGSNSTIIPGIKVGAHAKVGAGSVAIRKVKEGTTVMGVPAKEFRF